MIKHHHIFTTQKTWVVLVVFGCILWYLVVFGVIPSIHMVSKYGKYGKYVWYVWYVSMVSMVSKRAKSLNLTDLGPGALSL